MAVFPDLTMAVLYGVVVFLLVLGFLVVFVEKIPPRGFVAAVVAAAVVAIALVSAGEAGVALLAAGAGAAVIATHGFEWLTTR